MNGAHDTIIYVTRDLRFCVLPDFVAKPATITLTLSASEPRSGTDGRKQGPRNDGAATTATAPPARTMAAHLLTWQLWREIEVEALRMEDLWEAGDARVTEKMYREMCERMRRLRWNLSSGA